MSDNYPTDPNDLRNRGTKGVMSALGGVGLLVASALVAHPIVAGIIGGVLAILGLTGVISKKKTDRTAGSIVLIAGGVGLAAIFLHGPIQFLFGLGGVALLGYGAYSIFKFVKGLRQRA
jgi:hypothetical protein